MIPSIAIFDIGKTNKKFLIYDLDNKLIHEDIVNFELTLDDDGEECENVEALNSWVKETWKRLEQNTEYDIRAVNFTSYGATLVHLDENRKVVMPIYNYLKKIPKPIEDQFFQHYGGKEKICRETASPALGMLNSGLQLYWLKHNKPENYKKIDISLHLPQYLTFLITGELATEFTSIGCHTMLWNYQTMEYHNWVKKEGISSLFPQFQTHETSYTVPFRRGTIQAGVGLHDSSSALIPYLDAYKEPFLLLSTGTWAITLNPFADENLSKKELHQDCLQYLSYKGRPVKASRLQLGEAHERLIKDIHAKYSEPQEYYKSLELDKKWMEKRWKGQTSQHDYKTSRVDYQVNFEEHNYSSAYHEALFQLTLKLIHSIMLSAEGNLSKFSYLIIDGGFGRNSIFKGMLEIMLPDIEVISKESAQGTSEGAMLTIKKRI